MFKIDIIQEYGMLMGPSIDMKTSEAAVIINESKTEMEIIGNSYIYGYMMGAKSTKRLIPVLNIDQISDEKWNEMAKAKLGK